ncbi:MAG: response regulator [Bacteroidota bacterium]
MALRNTQAPLCWLVDDNLVDIELTLIALESIHPEMEIQVFYDGQEVLDLLTEEEYRQPDLMFLDVKMAEIDGLTLLKSLPHSFIEQTPIIILSNTTLEENLQRTKELGVKGVYEKPYEFWDTKELLNSILSSFLSLQTVKG